MTGWLLIFSLLVLGGILSTLGDRLGTRVGKARLSIFKLRPKSTAVLITVFTGSIISAISFAIMVAFNSQLRVGLFELEECDSAISDMADSNWFRMFGSSFHPCHESANS